MSNFHLIITTNGPGELSNWVSPLCNTIKNSFPEISISLYLVPCQLASGSEYQIAQKIPALKQIFSPKKTWLMAFGFKKPTKLAKRGAVLYLGGDHMYAKRIAKRYKYPVYAYSHSPIKKGFKHVFVRSITQDLMAENRPKTPTNKKEMCQKLGLDHQKKYLLFFTGSRPKQSKYLIPYFIETYKQLKKTKPHLEAILSISPFSQQSLLKPYLDEKPEGLHVLNAPSKDLYAVSDLLISIPGTNTAEAMYSSMPMFVCLPLIEPQVIDYPGLLGLLVKIPILNNVLFKLAIAYFKRKIKFYSLPNIILKQPLVEEHVGYFYPKDIAQKLDVFLDKPDAIEKQKQHFNKIIHSMQPICDQIIHHILSNSQDIS